MKIARGTFFVQKPTSFQHSPVMNLLWETITEEQVRVCKALVKEVWEKNDLLTKKIEALTSLHDLDEKTISKKNREIERLEKVLLESKKSAVSSQIATYSTQVDELQREERKLQTQIADLEKEKRNQADELLAVTGGQYCDECKVKMEKVLRSYRPLY